MRTLMFMLFGAAAAAGGALFYSNGLRLSGAALGQSQPPSGVQPFNALAELNALSDRFEAVAQSVLPAVVSIEASKASTSPTTKARTVVEDSGTGVIVTSSDGTGFVVVTNNHVIDGARAEQISISLADGRMIRPSRVIGDNETDVAILKIEGAGLPTAKLGDSDKVRIGQWVLALGSPFGLSQSVTHGIVSARERGRINLGNKIRIKDFIQTDAAINPGSSGGPLVNLNGEVIGINTAIASESGSNSGVAFSIPINLAKRVTKQLQDRGVVAHGYLGLEIDTGFEPAAASSLGLDRARGARIKAVVPESPAAIAGLKVNDVILQLDSVTIRSDNHLINLISMLPAGQRVRMQVWRDKKAMTVDAVVGDWNAYKKRFQTASAP